MAKQSTLFPQNELSILPELDLLQAARLANEVEGEVEGFCERIQGAGSIRRQRPKIHDIDLVVVAKSDADWQRIGETLRRLKAKPNCSGNQLIKAYVPYQNGLFQVDFYRAKPTTFGINLLVRTGSAEHNCWLAGQAISEGMRLKYSEGLIKDSQPVAGEDEKGVFSALGLPCPSPTEREIINNKPFWTTKTEDPYSNVRIQQRTARRAYMRGKRVHNYDRRSITITRKFHPVTDAFLKLDLTETVFVQNGSLIIVLTPKKN